MPTYNHVDYIDDAIRSVVEQDYPNLEVVVGDDGSTDGTREKVQAWAKRLPGRVVAVEGDHVGPVRNHNRVIAACRGGKYVAMTSGDDLFLPGKISRQVAWMEEDEERVMCGHHIEAFDSLSGKTIYTTRDTMKLGAGRGASRYISRMQLFPGIATFLRTTAIPAGGYDESVGIVADFKFMCDVLAGGGKYGYVEGILARYRVHAASLSQRSLREEEVARQYFDGFLTAFRLIESEHPELADACREGRSRVLFGEGRRLQRRGDRQGARSLFLQALRGAAMAVGARSLAGIALTLIPRFISEGRERLRP